MRELTRFTVIVIAISAAALAPAAFAVTAGDFLAEAGVGALCGYVVGAAGLGLYYLGNEPVSGNDDNDALIIAGSLLMAGSLSAMAAGVYVMGEAVDGPSANKFAAWALPTVAAYGSSFAVSYVARVAGAGPVGTVVGPAAVPFVTAWAYNAVKKPAGAPESRGPSLEPYAAVAAAGEGGPMPVYGFALSF